MASVGTRYNRDGDDRSMGSREADCCSPASSKDHFHSYRKWGLSLPSRGFTVLIPDEPRLAGWVVLLHFTRGLLSASRETRKLKGGDNKQEERTQDPLKALMLSPAACQTAFEVTNCGYFVWEEHMFVGWTIWWWPTWPWQKSSQVSVSKFNKGGLGLYTWPFINTIDYKIYGEAIQ